VGNNNVGKTSILNAIEFVILGKNKEDYISKNPKVDDDVFVTIVLNDVNEFEGSLKKYNSYIYEHQLIIQRSSKKITVKQGDPAKTEHLSIKNVRIFNKKKNQFENPTGVSGTIKDLLDPQFIYADIHNEDYQDFGTTKIMGKLIQNITKEFKLGEEFNELQQAHEKAFGKDGIEKYLNKTEGDIDNILKEQFGNTKTEFDFSFPNMNELLKKGTILATENGVKTDISEKGNGLQRSIAIAIIQIYSKLNNTDDKTQYIIDEPEIYLHPKAQDKLIESLINLSDQNNQVFISTHSPYILRHYRKGENKDSIVILSRTEDDTHAIKQIEQLLFSPTAIGEVTYKAFGVPTVDFHQMLFTKIYIDWIEHAENGRKSLLDFEKKFLVSNCSDIMQEFTPRYKGKWDEKVDRTLPYIVRNEIDHPELLEDGKNIWTEDNLKQSIDCLIKLYEKYSFN